jgi:hypothetical protein
LVVGQVGQDVELGPEAATLGGQLEVVVDLGLEDGGDAGGRGGRVRWVGWVGSCIVRLECGGCVKREGMSRCACMLAGWRCEASSATTTETAPGILKRVNTGSFYHTSSILWQATHCGMLAGV